MAAPEISETLGPSEREAPAQARTCFEELVTQRQLTPEELGELAKRMVDASDPAEAARLKELIIAGFYGPPVDA